MWRIMTKAQLFVTSVVLCFVIINLAPNEYFRGRPPEEKKRPKIFFHETSGRGVLNSRQACAVEAAARAHPDWDVLVLFLAPEIIFNKRLKQLQAIDNIRFAEINLSDYAKGTPLQKFVNSGALNQSRWKLSHTSDVLRYLTLYKFGGVYLDLDTVVVKSFNSLKKNWSARESVLNVAAGAMSLWDDALGRTVANMTVKDLAANFRGDIWGNNGPGVITRVLQNLCSVRNVTKMSSSICKGNKDAGNEFHSFAVRIKNVEAKRFERTGGFEVYGPELFYPIRWQDAKQYFKPGYANSTKVYVYHVWNKHTSKYDIPKNSLYANLAKEYCPSVYQDNLEDFGFKSKITKLRDSKERTWSKSEE